MDWPPRYVAHAQAHPTFMRTYGGRRRKIKKAAPIDVSDGEEYSNEDEDSDEEGSGNEGNDSDASPYA